MCAMSIIGKLNRSGMEACRKGLFSEAESNLLAALEQALMKGSRCTEAKIQNNLGILYELWGNNGRARDHYANALRLMEAKLSTNHPLHQRLVRSIERTKR